MLHRDLTRLDLRSTRRCWESYVDTVEMGDPGHVSGGGNSVTTQLEIAVV